MSQAARQDTKGETIAAEGGLYYYKFNYYNYYNYVISIIIYLLIVQSNTLISIIIQGLYYLLIN